MRPLALTVLSALAVLALAATPALAATDPATLAFPDQTLGTTSAPQSVTLTNTESTPLRPTPTTSGDFALDADGCSGATLAPGASCSVSVRFTPTGMGARSGTLTFTDSGGASPQAVPLTGNGILLAFPAGPIDVTPSAVAVSIPRQRLRVLGKSGLYVLVSASEPTRVFLTAQVTLPRPTAHSKPPTFSLGPASTATVSSAKTTRLILHLTKKSSRRLQQATRAKILVTSSNTDLAGNVSKTQRSITLHY